MRREYGRVPDSGQSFDLTVTAYQVQGQDAILPYNDELQIIIEDNGQGLPAQEGSTQNGGQGLALHSTMMAIIGGSMSIDSIAGEYTQVTLAFPSSIAS